MVARIGGAGTGSAGRAAALLLHGHLNIVPADPADWSVHPFSGEYATEYCGGGAVDMKNADAVLIALAAEWARSGRRPQRDIVLAFTADEEDTGAFGAQWLVERRRSCSRAAPRPSGSPGRHLPCRAGPAAYPIASAERGTPG